LVNPNHDLIDTQIINTDILQVYPSKRLPSMENAPDLLFTSLPGNISSLFLNCFVPYLSYINSLKHLTMKTPFFYLIAGLLLFVSYPKLNAQDENQNPVAVAEYMKVKPGMWDKYMDCERVWKKIHQYRKDKAMINGWELERLVFPSGTGSEYDFMTVTHFPSWDGIDNQAWYEQALESLTDDEKKIALAAEDYRDLVKREIWTAGEMAFGKSEKSPKYRVENYMKLPAGGMEDWSKMESEFVKPVHQKNIEKGNRAGWLMAYMILPRGSEQKYDVSTIDFYDNWADMDNNEGDAWKEVHPDLNWETLDKKFESTRTIVRTEVRVLVEEI
jgi:hypothetical protein